MEHLTGLDQKLNYIETRTSTHSTRNTVVDENVPVASVNDKNLAQPHILPREYRLNPSDNKRILRKIDLVILPVIICIYFLQQLDKSTLSYASVFDLIDDTRLKGTQYSWLGSVVYVAQLVFQIPVAFLLVRFDNARIVLFVVLAWGIVLACASAATNFTGLMIARFMLGGLESFIAPAFIAITQAWYRRDEQTTRIAYWYCTNGVTNMVGSILTYGLASIPSHSLKKYQIIFLFCGALTIGFCPFIYYFLEGSPREARLLAKDEDRMIALERIRTNQMGKGDERWNSSHVRECLMDIKTWCWFIMILTISIVSGGITTFGPLILKAFGFDSFKTILMNIPFGFVQFCATIGSALASQRYRLKGPIIAGLCLPPITGCIMLLYLKHDGSDEGALLAGYYLISFYPAITPMIYAWSSQNTAGNTKRKVNSGIVIMGSAIGNIIGPQLYNQKQAPLYKSGLWCNLGLLITVFGMAGVTTLVLHHLNRQHEKRRVLEGGPAKFLDQSMIAVKDMLNALEVERASDHLSRPQTQQEHLEETRMLERRKIAFDQDETDLQNEFFTFVY